MRAFALHSSLSLLIAGLLLLVVYTIWYPSPFHNAVGVSPVLGLVILVDVTIGPLVTLMLCRAGRRVPIVDFIAIGVLQISALSTGVLAVAEGRPAWIVFNADRFDLIRSVDVDPRSVAIASPTYRTPSLLGPTWVAAAWPDSSEERIAILFEALNSGIDLAHRPQYYGPIEQKRTEIQARLRPLEELDRYNSPAAVTQVLEQWNSADAWLPMVSGVKSMTVLLERETTKIVAVVDLNPWANE